jgi:hypothetical protein
VSRSGLCRAELAKRDLERDAYSVGAITVHCPRCASPRGARCSSEERDVDWCPERVQLARDVRWLRERAETWGRVTLLYAADALAEGRDS